jgi:large subunit ribosomal protein L22
MEAKAVAKYVRVSARKARLVANEVRGYDYTEAVDILKFTQKRVADEILNVVNSAAANAVVADAKIDLTASNLQVAVPLDTHFLQRFKLALQTCKFGCILTVALNEECGGPEKNDGASGHPSVLRLLRILHARCLCGPARNPLHFLATVKTTAIIDSTQYPRAKSINSPIPQPPQAKLTHWGTAFSFSSFLLMYIAFTSYKSPVSPPGFRT